NEDKILKVQDVKIRFGEQTLLSRFNKTDPYFYAVKGVTFSVNQGETVALVGESGSGKTTVAQGIMGLVDTCGGEINCMGQPLSTMSKSQLAAMRREAVMIFQDPMGSLNPRMSVRNIVLEPYDIQGIRIKNREREANRLLTMVGLGPDFAERYPHQLSGGQARRVGVARALMLGPKLIVADEPTSGLDVSVQGEVLNLFLELKEKLGIALLIITHNLNIVRHVADRVLIMYMGEILEQGRTDEVFANPRHEYTKQLLAANSYAIETL
ncbi:MAG: ABC transporter ATP-binding protein, partial [Desulfobulbaceae bacterium]|nr:ABC transporter ATP-binding protein [Desulfobulbaceae bacterium]